MQNYNKTQVVADIQRGMNAFCDIACAISENKSHKQPRYHKDLSDRALQEMRSAVNNPTLYFSRAATEGAWAARGQEHAKRFGVNVEWATHYIVNNPADELVDRFGAAFMDEAVWRNRLWIFCEQVIGWYYAEKCDTKSAQASEVQFAQQIHELCEQICHQRDVVCKKDFKYYLKNNKFAKWVRGLQR